MFSFTIEVTMLKGFMNKLLREEAFDFFICRSVEIFTFARFEISAPPERGLKEPEAKEAVAKESVAKESEAADNYREACMWKEIKPHVFNILKGNKKPKSMKIVLALPSEMVRQMHPNAAAYFFNIYFEGEAILCTASSSEKVFSMDKTLEVKWEEYIKSFMREISIAIS